MSSDAPASSASPAADRPRFLHVVFLNGNQRWYQLDSHGWRLDSDHRTVVVGKGLGRKHIPLDNVEYYSPE